jgi:hypothetical protein
MKPWTAYRELKCAPMKATRRWSAADLISNSASAAQMKKMDSPQLSQSMSQHTCNAGEGPMTRPYAPPLLPRLKILCSDSFKPP